MNGCLLQFKKMEREDLATLAPYFAGKGTIAADYSLLYFHMWNSYLRSEYAIENDVLFVRRNTRHGVFYYPPLRLGSSDLLSDVPLLFRVTDQETVALCAIPDHELAALETACAVIEKDTSRRWADYIYAAEDLATLRGKRYHKKRNLVSQFERLYPDRAYEEIGAHNLGEVAAFLRELMRETELTEDERFEDERVLEVLADYEALPLCGGLIRVEGRIVAFAVGERVDDTLLVHIEKAHRAYKGAYQYINYRFVGEELARASFSLVNREDDTGDEGLRQAKLSYHPVRILHKYRALIKNTGEG